MIKDYSGYSDDDVDRIMSIRPHHLLSLPLISSGWMNFTDVENLSRGIITGVYSIAICAYIPSDNYEPWNVKDTSYIGKTGGNKNECRIDDKNGDRIEATLYKETTVHNRLKAHDYEIRRYASGNIPSADSVNFSKTYLTLAERLKETKGACWYHIYYLNPTINKKYHKSCTDILLCCESEMISSYKSRWKSIPVGNLAHNPEKDHRVKDSQSHRTDRIIKLRGLPTPSLDYFMLDKK